MRSFSSWVCPFDHSALKGATCVKCGRVYREGANGQLDFRLREPITISHSWHYEPTFGRFPWELAGIQWPDIKNGVVTELGQPERSILGTVPPASPEGAVALDIGCGESHQRFRAGLLALNYTPIGIDVIGDAPDALADAHLLPLPDQSVDLLLTSAVWEHLKHPHVAMAEAARVARPGALFVGSVAFGEPFHISYFHHSPLAMFELLDSSGFAVEAIILLDSYSAIFAHLDMGYIGQRLPRALHSPLATAVRWLATAPGVLRGRGDAARLAFARSHAASVGFIGRRR